MRPDILNSKTGRLAAMVCLLAVAGACAFSAAEVAPGASTPSTAKAQPAWVQAPAKHGGSGVSLRYSLPASLEPGQPGALQLQLGGIAEDDASAELRVPAGMTLTDATGAAPTRLSLPRGQITTLNFTVSAAAEGLQFIDVFTTQGGRSSAQSIALKVGKGEPALKKNGELRTGPGGERVISLPAK